MLDDLLPRPCLTAEEKQLLDSVRTLARERIEPRAAGHDETAGFPWDNIADINALGLNRMFIPSEFGGYPLSYTAYLASLAAISGACASTGLIWATNFHAVAPIVTFGDDLQKARWLPVIAAGGLAALAITEPAGGSDATSMTTRFVPQDDTITISGGKAFITSGDVADICLVFGKWSEIGAGRAAISAVVVEKGSPGFDVLRRENKMGHRASSTVALRFDDCRVPRSNLLGRPGEGLQILLATLNKSRPSIAVHALAIARAALGDAVAYANQRQVRGKRIIEHQGNKFLVADLATELVLCETLLWTLAAQVDAGATDIGIHAAMLKLRSADLAMRITTEATQLCGGYGYCRDLRLERLMRDAKLLQIGEGSAQTLREVIGRRFVARPLP